MAKRIRYVHPVDMVAHLWANQSQDSARDKRGNFYFYGDTIYSYGAHFPIARHVATKRGRAVLFTTRGYSVTTTGHKWTVEGACRHLTVFHVQDPTSSDRKGQFAEYRQRYVELARKYSRARSNKPWILGSLRDTVAEAKGGKSRTVALDPEAWAVLQAWLERKARMGITGPVFSTLHGEPLLPSYVRTLFKSLGSKAHIAKRVHPHGLRHTFAAGLADEKIDIRIIQRALGHSSLGTTQRYVDHLNPTAVIDALRARTW